MRILSLDISTVAIGLALWDGKKISDYCTVKKITHGTSVTKGLREMSEDLIIVLRDLFGRNTQYEVEITAYTKKGDIKKSRCIPHTIFLIEDDFVRGKAATMALGKARGMVEDILLDYTYPFEKEMIHYLMPSEWKLAAFGKGCGAMDKAGIIAAVKAWGYNPQTEDEADAIGMLIAWNNMKQAA